MVAYTNKYKYEPHYICKTCDQVCKQYKPFDHDKCKLWTGRNVFAQRIFEEDKVDEGGTPVE